MCAGSAAEPASSFTKLDADMTVDVAQLILQAKRCAKDGNIAMVRRRQIAIPAAAPKFTKHPLLTNNCH